MKYTMPPTQSPHSKSTLVSLSELLFEVIALEEKHLMDVLFPRFLGRVAQAHSLQRQELEILLNWIRALGVILLITRYFPTHQTSERLVGWELRRALQRYLAETKGLDETARSRQLERTVRLLQTLKESDTDTRIGVKTSLLYLEEIERELPEADAAAVAAIQFVNLLLTDDFLAETCRSFTLR